MKRTPLKAKRAGKRRILSPRCTRQRCNNIARIRDLCVQHAEKLADELFSRYVRDRDGGCTFPPLAAYPNHGGPLQAAHGEPRGNHATRYDEMDCHTLCRDHHMLVDSGSKHALKAVWLISILGDDGYAALLDEALRPARRTASIADTLDWLAPQQEASA